MTRLAGSSLTETQSSVIASAICVSLGISGGTGNYNFTSADRDVVIDGITYSPGAFSVSGIEERDDSSITMRRITFALGEQDLKTVMQTRSNYVWKTITIIDAMLLSDGTALSTGIWTGYITSRAIVQGSDEGTITITGQDWFAILGKTGTVRFDDVSQQQRAPGDTFFANMPGLKGQHIIWTGNRSQTGGSGGAPPPPGSRVDPGSGAPGAGAGRTRPF